MPFDARPGVLKGDGMDDVVRDATMMGVAAIEPVVTAHTAVKPAFAKRAENVERGAALRSRRPSSPPRDAAAIAREPVGLDDWLVGALGGSAH